MQPESKHIFVTGAGSGIGRALALDAAARGMQVALCGRRWAALEETAALTRRPETVLVIPADLTCPADRHTVATVLKERWGRLDLLVNNAGCVRGGALAEMGDDTLNEVLDANVVAPIALTRDLTPLLAAAGGARVVNVGSMFGDIAYPGFATYSASKHALRGFSDALRREWGEEGIGVTYAAPRATRTPAATAFDALIDATGMRLDEPADVARRILDAALAGKDTVYPRGAEPLFVIVQRLFPRLIDHALARQHADVAPARRRPIPIA